MTLPTRVGSAQQTTGFNAVNVTTGAIAAGSWMLAAVIHNGTTITETTPAGWRLLVSGELTDMKIGTRRWAVFGKIHGQLADGTADTNDNGKTFWTFDISANNTTRAAMWWGTGAKPVSTWYAGAPRKRAGTTAEQYESRAPSLTTTDVDTLVMGLHAEATAAAETDASKPAITSGSFTNWSKYKQGTGSQTSVIESLAADYREMATAGATGDDVLTWENPQTANAGSVQIAIPGVGAVDPVGAGYSLKMKVDATTFADRKLYVKTANGMRTPGQVRQVRPGVGSVTELLAKPEFVVAHRGGSVNFPEMSLYAYTQSLMRRVDALEFSVGVTSDNVWFGLHDQDINRTSGLAAGTLPAAKLMTWAEVQQYLIVSSITDDATQANQPYPKLVDVLAIYPDLVWFLDPKYLGSSGAVALFTWLKANIPNATERFVFKYYFDATNLANQIGALGFKSWGYLYAADLANANFTALIAPWTILGFDYGSSDANWADFKSRMDAAGKKYTGHIAPTQAAVNRALSYGAIGNMVSGVRQVKGF